MKSQLARVLIADDHTLVAQACKGLLEPEFELVGIVADGRAAVQAAAELRPHVIVVDISMPLLNGLDAGEQIKEKNPAIKLVYLTMMLERDVAAEAFRRGGSGYVPKHCSAEELMIAVRRVLLGESYLSPVITRGSPQIGRGYHDEKPITGRQREILQLLAEGRPMKEIAYILALQVGTVAFHKYKIMGALGIKTSAGLIEHAINRRMISSTERIT